MARNEATNAEVAVKILLTAGAGVDDEAIARFRREAHAAAQLYHRGIVRIFDLVELDIRAGVFVPALLPAEDGDSVIRSARRPPSNRREPAHVPDALVMVMELLRGETLASRMDRQRRFSLDQTYAILLPLLSALAHAHAQGIVHRDLKPENVFLSVDPDGHVIPKILDFGISKLLQPAVPRITTDGAMLGTPNYMSPEQARGQADVDARADVFSAGIVLYEMLAGENPFSSGSYHSVVAAILEREPTPIAGLLPEVWRVIQRALEKPPQLRYTDAAELASALKKAAPMLAMPDASGAHAAFGSIPDASVPPAPFREPERTIPSIYAKGQKRARLRVWLGAGVIAAALAAAAGVYSTTLILPEPGPSPPPAAQAERPPTAAPVAEPARTVVEPPPAPRASAAIPPPVEATAPSSAASTRPLAPPPTAHPPMPSMPSTPSSPRAKATPPPPSPAASAPPPPQPAAPSGTKSSVVRDPGF